MGFFSQDSKFMKFMDRFVDVLWLNLLWIVCCLPIITIGASTVAAYYVSLKMVDEQDSYVARSFFKAFKENFKKGTILWVLNAIALYALWLDFQLVTVPADPSFFLIFVGIASAILVFLAFIYAYPQMARYENSIKNILENSVRMCFRYFGKTFLLLALLILEVAVFTWNTTLMFFGIIIGPMVMIYTISAIARNIFQKIHSSNPTP